jgi:response regulator RpfG family c-di-GMP phosphodiesterase
MSLNERLRELVGESPKAKRHAERVAVMAVATAYELGVSGDELLLVRIAAELHDVSLVGQFDEVAPIIKARLERWDGSGRPRGLVGEDIPIAARIVGLVEHFDNAAYDNGGDEQAALDELWLHSGTLFDPDVVEAFLRVQPLIQPVLG